MAKHKHLIVTHTHVVEQELPTLYVGQAVSVRHRPGPRQETRVAKGTIYYVSRFGWATVDFRSYREAFPLSEIEPMGSSVKEWREQA